MLQLQAVKKIYFIGIGGIGMSAVAGISAHKGFDVSGVDAKTIYAPAKTVLDKYSIRYNVGYDAEHIVETKPDLVVVGGGETNENVEVKRALEDHIPITSFAELLYELTKEKYRIVVTGTHGKTTTSSIITLLLQAMGYNPGFFIGGLVSDLETNFRYAEGKFFVIEGDEYYSSFFDNAPKFLHYRPNMLVMNNIEMDHFDYFDTKQKLLDAFSALIGSMPASGVIVANRDDENVVRVLKDSPRRVIWFSTEDETAQWFGKFCSYKEGLMEFEMFLERDCVGRFLFTKPGIHNLKNITGAFACVCAQELADFFMNGSGKIEEDPWKRYVKEFAAVLSRFQGPKRRFELVSELGGVTIIDDYAHHATAVCATLDAAKKLYPKSRLWAVFEPHTFTRTKETLHQLENAFFASDIVIISEIYAAREAHLKGLINGEKVASSVKKKHKEVHFIPTREEVLNYLLRHVKKGDVVVVMAVGDFNSVALDLRDRLKERKRVKRAVYAVPSQRKT